MSPLLLIALLPLALVDQSTHRNLGTAREIQGIPCAAGDAWFFPDGRLAKCSLSGDFTIGVVRAPKGTWLSLTPAGTANYIFLARNTRISGYFCKGGGLLGPAEGPSTALYPSGALKTCWLVEDTEVDGVPCAHASMLADMLGGNSGTYFRESGKLEACMLSRPFRFAGKDHRKGDRFQLPQQ